MDAANLDKKTRQEIGVLVLQTGRQAGARRPLGVPTTFVGRGPACDIRLNVAGVDPLHCLIVAGPDGVQIRDLDSAEGTYRNGTRTDQGLLCDGDILKVGPFQFRVELAPQAARADDRSNEEMRLGVAHSGRGGGGAASGPRRRGDALAAAQERTATARGATRRPPRREAAPGPALGRLHQGRARGPAQGESRAGNASRQAGKGARPSQGGRGQGAAAGDPGAASASTRSINGCASAGSASGPASAKSTSGKPASWPWNEKRSGNVPAACTSVKPPSPRKLSAPIRSASWALQRLREGRGCPEGGPGHLANSAFPGTPRPQGPGPRTR